MPEVKPRPIIFLDLDGVLADFVQAALRLHFGDDWQQYIHSWPKGEYATYTHMGLSNNQFWAKINKAGSDFWADLPMFPWTEELVRMCGNFGDVCILSSPSINPDCVQGKVRWLRRVLGGQFRDYVFAPRQHKWMLAAPNRYMIEDSEQNATEFVAAGGSGAVIVPQPWNTRGMLPPVRVAVNVARELGELICRVR